MQTPLPKNIIKIEPVQDLFAINWRFDIRCNYDCSYCDTAFHSTTSKPKTLEILQDEWTKIYNLVPKNKKIKLNYLGGEPTANKNLVPLIDWINENFGHRILISGVSTNGSAPLKIYKKLIEKVYYITFSVHSEFYNEKQFFKNVIETKKLTLGTDKIVNVNVMDEGWNSDRISVYQEWLTRFKIDHKIMKINWNRAHRLIPIHNAKTEEYDFAKDLHSRK